jgi:hypothetical protein
MIAMKVYESDQDSYKIVGIRKKSGHPSSSSEHIGAARKQKTKNIFYFFFLPTDS